MRSLHLFVFLTFSCTSSVNGRHPTCNFMLELQRDEEECYRRLKKQEKPITKGCKGFWDNISCWDQAEIGETVTIPCPRVLKSLFGRNGYISKNCTASGWSRVFPNITSVCESEAKQEKYLWCYCMGVLESVCSVIELRIHLLRLSLFGTIVVSSLSMKRLKVQEDFWLVFYTVVKTLYTLGHSLSLIALTTGSAILCLFRKLHCTRNYIHLNLFFSFILRAVAVLVKDDILFSHNTQCSNQPSLIGCKASLVIFHYFIMANFFWLLVEGLYLHTLLMVIFSENRHFIVYLLIGWGFPTVFVFAWIMARLYLEDTGCWEVNENAIALWVINGPIMFSIMVNFILFISIIRILVQKLRCPDVGGNDQSQYRRLAKSTLLLIPLFGVHYVVFVSLNESMADYKIFFDLALGSFQGLVVAILYCFLNSEVQGELKRKWGSVSLDCHMSKEFRRNGSLAYRNGTDNAAQFHRNSRAQSLLQTETTVL